MWAETARAVTVARERRLREAGLVEVWPGIGNSGRIVVCRRGGLQAVCREELSTPRPSPAKLMHSCTTATVVTQLERQGKRTLSEREILATERSGHKRIYSAQLGGRRMRAFSFPVSPKRTSSNPFRRIGPPYPRPGRRRNDHRSRRDPRLLRIPPGCPLAPNAGIVVVV